MGGGDRSDPTPKAGSGEASPPPWGLPGRLTPPLLRCSEVPGTIVNPPLPGWEWSNSGDRSRKSVLDVSPRPPNALIQGRSGLPGFRRRGPAFPQGVPERHPLQVPGLTPGRGGGLPPPGRGEPPPPLTSPSTPGEVGITAADNCHSPGPIWNAGPADKLRSWPQIFREVSPGEAPLHGRRPLRPLGWERRGVSPPWAETAPAKIRSGFCPRPQTDLTSSRSGETGITAAPWSSRFG
jgi:hypothetical protein